MIMSQGLWVIFVDCDNFEIYFETFDDSFNSVGFVQLEIISILSSLVDFQVPFTITSSNEFWTSNESGPRGVNLREFFKCLFQEKYGLSDKDENKNDSFQFGRWKHKTIEILISHSILQKSVNLLNWNVQ